MKVIAFALFGDPGSFEYQFYRRGLYFNLRMAKLLYPGWEVDVMVHTKPWQSGTEQYLNALERMFPVNFVFNEHKTRCESMLWRMKPLYYPTPDQATHVICRDLDAILTYKDRQAVQEWEDSGLGFHGITDDQAHSIPMMGGMCGFKRDIFFSTFPEYDTFEKLVAGADLRDHGTDQNLLMSRIYPKARQHMFGHFFKGCTERVVITKTAVSNQVPGVDSKLWESNLTCRMIGSPGVVDMEVLRFFKRFDPDPRYDQFEQEFRKICYWVA